jgi:hypothetical protein
MFARYRRIALIRPAFVKRSTATTLNSGAASGARHGFIGAAAGHGLW